jgi:16S rRNA G966 N2-methylase RsmD
LKNYVLFDFNTPDGFPEELKGTFDCVVIDPPFITREVWEKYTRVSVTLCRWGSLSVSTAVPRHRRQQAAVSPQRLRHRIREFFRSHQSAFHHRHLYMVLS